MHPRNGKVDVVGIVIKQAKYRERLQAFLEKRDSLHVPKSTEKHASLSDVSTPRLHQDQSYVQKTLKCRKVLDMALNTIDSWS